jgi:hypothetical protein
VCSHFANPFVKESGMAGDAWVEGFFLHHHRMVASRKVQNLNPGRAQKLNRFFVNDCFAKLLDNNGRTRK